MLHTFHARHGLFFQRLPLGVRVIKTLDGGLPVEGGSGNIVVDVTLPANEWDSVVTAMAEPCTFRDDGLEARAAWSDAQRRASFISPFNDHKNGG